MKQILLLMVLLLPRMVSAQVGVSHAYICPGDSVGLVAYSENADVYEWFKDGLYLTSTVEKTLQVTGLGNYSVIAYNFNGCKSDPSNAFVIEQDTLRAERDTASLHSTTSAMIAVVNNDKKGCYDLNRQSVQIVRDPWRGKAIIRGDGMVEYIPDRGTSGEDNFEYTVTDMNYRVSNVAVVTIWVGNECGVVFPNPAYDKVKVRTRNQDVRYVRFCEISGRILKVEPMAAGEKELDIVNYPPAVYVLQLMDGNGKTLCTYKVDKRQNN